jgi:hypothetical protein
VRPNGFRSWTSQWGSYGEWAADELWGEKHETGHILLLPDDYHDDIVNGQAVSVPNPGHAGHMMAEDGGNVVQHEINDLLHKNGCKCQQLPQH